MISTARHCLGVGAAFADELPLVAKIRLNGARAIVGELIEQSRERLKLRDLKRWKEVAYSQDDLLKVERDVADSDAIAAAGLPVFVARKLSREQVGPSAGKIADVTPTGRQKRLAARKRGARTV